MSSLGPHAITIPMATEWLNVVPRNPFHSHRISFDATALRPRLSSGAASSRGSILTVPHGLAPGFHRQINRLRLRNDHARS